MLITFFQGLRNAQLPVSVREWLDLIAALEARCAFANMDEFYYLARACLIKDEKFFDRFDRAFALCFKDMQDLDDVLEALLPDDWLRSEFAKHLSDEEKAAIDSMGGLEKLIEEFKKRLDEQRERHAGGDKWIGTSGTSPFGHDGYNPEGVRIGGEGKHQRAVKVWERRDFRDLDDDVEIGTRNARMALRRLRKLARTGAEEELDLPGTIESTARRAGMLDIQMVPERRNAVKVLLFLDVGGSMDPYVRACAELFSAARSEFKYLEYFYFHNFLYESVWRDNVRRHQERINTWDVLHKYGADYKVAFVGDASMSPYEIVQSGGSVEHWNEEPGALWMQRVTEAYDKVIWLNPLDAEHWEHIPSAQIVSQLVDEHMYPMTVRGIEQAATWLAQ